jgi:hypothetical protein
MRSSTAQSRIARFDRTRPALGRLREQLIELSRVVLGSASVTFIFEAIFEVLVGVTGMMVLRLFGQRDRDPADTACTIAGLAVWLVLAGFAALLAHGAGWF